VFPLGLALACGHLDRGHQLAAAMPKANNGSALAILAAPPVPVVVQVLAESTTIVTRLIISHQWAINVVTPIIVI
jgi:hypothetical protein